MEKIVNDFVVNVATANGTGSQSSNLIILHSKLEKWVPVRAKNLFPSNISGFRHGSLSGLVIGDIRLQAMARTFRF